LGDDLKLRQHPVSAAIFDWMACRSTDWNTTVRKDAGHSGRKRAEWHAGRWHSVRFSDRDGDRFAAGTLLLQRWGSAAARPAGHLSAERVVRALDWGAADAHRWARRQGGDISRRVGECSHGGRRHGRNNFEAVGAPSYDRGIGGSNFDAFYGSVVISRAVRSATFWRRHRGSVVNITGGEVGNVITADSGSVVNGSGGLSADSYYYELRAAAGSEVIYSVTDFF